MPAADPPAAHGGSFRRFVGRYGDLLMFLVLAVLAVVLLVVWRTWDVELLEYGWFQILVFLVVAAPLVALRFWGEGALPPAGGTPGRRRPRGQREKPRRSGRRRRR
ncbi:hypothetical protein ACH4OY_07595 [Micromonospora rubida]|uniref:Uncharacterized protein n=1 Tax=Micromonospora rubida TaxID=2697657 RepID=A0ABW7SFT1_9ACTN|nr:hypothetical protein [Micromonospora rubida]NBE80904.1 hypothetical protein [Micromonospora rubida]